MTDTPDLQPRTNGAASSEFAVTKWSTMTFVGIVAVEAIINAVVYVLRGQSYDAINDVTFGILATVLVGGAGWYTTARTMKKGTLAKTAAGIDPFVIKKLGESIVAAAKGATK